jgi:DNA repair exonuclease SbcCD ATPase subunit
MMPLAITEEEIREKLKKLKEDEEVYSLYLQRLLTIIEIRRAYRDTLIWIVASLQSKLQAALQRIVENFHNILTRQDSVTQAMRSLILASSYRKSLEEDLMRIRSEINELVKVPEFSQTVSSIESVLEMIKKVE